jgi:hypothetical protein
VAREHLRIALGARNPVERRLLERRIADCAVEPR